MKRFVGLLFATALVLGLSYGMHGPVVPVFAKDSIGATYAELGLIGTANFLPYMIIPIFVGILLDRINSRYLLTIGVLLNALSLYLISIANSVEEVVAYRLIAGVAHAFFWPTSESILSGDESTRVKYISWFIMFFVVGFMVGPLLGALVLDMAGSDYRMLFQITVFVMVVAMASSIVASPKGVKLTHGGLNLKSFGAIARFPVVVILLLFSTAIFGVVLAIYPAFLSDRGINDNSVLLLFFIFGITRVGALLVSGFLSKRAIQTFTASTIMVSVGMGISAVGTSFGEFVIALLMLGFGCSILYPLALEVILSGTKKSASGRMIGAYEAIFGVGWAIGPAISGYTTDAFGEAAPYWLFCILGIAVTIMVVIFRRRLERVSSERAQSQ
ncbi:MAG: MFS transporter [Cenarchaeum sp. SB0661_bin_35]|nr:MFS transporter [Cenarchaeum sp. SB0667_bin_13]MXY37621.1 MFS transporter [Cenarchaeum sp. SB0664_bin_35]MXZ93674.1 MFS transporter [Cenarchaeum sp. SB0666_bin_15]MYB46508.1 MFS transporter [Cenarchaeum sp. SB0662_bin_33]MYC80399.1 MFS transporter [Cenarchaeum sp. SB0661_bin_35]MYD59038.1 MFS transporter [Cenarchaeum sp. SB0678_bin_8]MYG32788.1 MFS transporter [Cenarchaeum sp. SB0677_bin_16]MYI52243.1 MFS transporter [Cenarchaeum sp. SB0673_bin_9]MYJ27402.1 MFS transporter [Cenarchaeum s